ncbi:MAG TPA: TonB-dependent receptor, partial [Steroidobacteraceae bacterium]|nr:TonB-dependent receptor [Steroidobacteraceae bacterium]
MSPKRVLPKTLILLLAACSMRPVLSAEPPLTAVAAADGAIVGIVRNSADLAVGGATVTASRLGGGGIRATISGSDGMYSFADVPQGSWVITSHVDGAPDTVTPVEVSAGKAARKDLVMDAPAASSARVAAAAAAPQNDGYTPLANVGYIGWMNGTPREKDPVFDTKFFTPEVRLDVNYLQSLNRPMDHTIDGSTEEFRSGEFQLEQVSFGGDFHWNNVRARFLSMFGMFSTTTPRNDASNAVGQWQLSDAYRYFSEANAGYHFDVNHGLNVDAGVFVSYVGLFSYYNYDNWTYQPSFVSSNTPWFFNGLRVQWWPTQNLKIEPWLINGWQSYAKFNRHPGLGGQILWIPNDSLKLVFNTYSAGQDNLNCQSNAADGRGTMDTLCQPQNGGNPNAAAGSYVGAGP